MVKRRIYKNPKCGEKILVTARQLQKLLFDCNGKLDSREYADLRRMELVESSVRDAIHGLKAYPLATLTQRFDTRLLGRGKRVFARLDAEGDT